MIKYLRILSFALPAVLAAEPVSYPGGRLIQSFNNPSFNAKGNITETWVDGKSAAGWYSSASQIIYGWSGAATTSAMYGFRFDSSGNTSSVAGAIGSKTVSEPIHFAWALRNDSGQAVNELNLSYIGFAANSETHPDTPDQLSFSYKVGGMFSGESYLAVADFNYTYNGGNARDNPIPGSTAKISGTLHNLNWQPGDVLWLRWTDEHDAQFGGVAMGIDHIRVSSPTPRATFYDEWMWAAAFTTREYHVNPAHPAAADENTGSLEAPLLTIQRAISKAKFDSAAGFGSRIWIHPGIYRELIDITERPGNLPLELLAVETGTVVMSGSDIFADWQPVSGMDNVLAHHWPYKFGWEANPWPGDLAMRYPEGSRRELLFNNKRPMTQVVSASELAEGTYLVDETNNRILFFPPFGVDPNATLTEASVRPAELYGEFSKLLRIFRVNNVRIKGLNFEHASASSFANDSAVALRGTSNIILEDLVLTYNNGAAISYGEQGDTPAENVIFRNIIANFNGSNGITGGGVANLLMENIETSYNNWRGALWGATGWAPCGFKFAFLSGAILRDFKVTQNHATGGWMDAGNQDVLIERYYSANNYRAGISLEANFGPIVIRDSFFYGNTVGINGFDNSGVEIVNSMIFGNSTGQIRMAGSTTLSEEQLLGFEEGWARDRQWRRHIPENWTIRDSFIGITGTGIPYMYSIDVRGGTITDENGQTRYIDFPDSFRSINTSYFHPSGSSARAFPDLFGIGVSFPEWEQIFKTQDSGNQFINESTAQAFADAAIELADMPMTGFTGAVATAPVVEVTALDRFAFEDGEVSARFRISRREGDMNVPLVVIFQLDGTALQGTDYRDPGDRVQIEVGDEYADVEITPIADGEKEFVETVILNLQPDLDGLYRLTGTRNAELRIVDMDSMTPSRIDVYHGKHGKSQKIQLSISNPSSAQISLREPSIDGSYTAVNSSMLDGPDHSWSPLGANSTVVPFNWLITNRDGVSSELPLGFSFPFFGNYFNSLYVHSNGFLTFDSLRFPTRSYSSPLALPSDNENVNPNTIAGFWSNFTMVTGSRIATRSSSDNFTVEFLELNRFPAFGTPQRINHQMVLYPNGQIDLVYQKNTYSSPSQSVGLQGPSNAEGLSISFNDSHISTPLTVRLLSAQSWIRVERFDRDIAASSYANLELILDGRGLLEGNYETTVEISDPEGNLLYVLPVSLTVGDLLEDATAVADSWKSMRALGVVNTEHLPWIYSASHGWIYIHRAASTNLILFLPEVGWVWSHYKLFPYAWAFQSSTWFNTLSFD